MIVFFCIKIFYVFYSWLYSSDSIDTMTERILDLASNEKEAMETLTLIPIKILPNINASHKGKCQVLYCNIYTLIEFKLMNIFMH